jgi:hypothetical protein
METKRVRAGLVIPRIFGSIDLVAALVVLLGVFVGLPARWWVVDVPAIGVATLLAGAGVGLVGGFAWGERAARLASMVTLALGLVLVATLAMTASYLSGVYGAVGRGGAVILTLVAALALPYLVALPASQLLWLGPGRTPASGTTGKSAGEGPA